MNKRIALALAVLGVLALAFVGLLAYAEPKPQKVAATDVVSNVDLSRASRSLVIINDGPSSAFVRAFRATETVVDAVATMPPSIEIKAGEHFSFGTELGQLDFVTVSYRCAAGQTASVRLVGE